MSRKKVTEEYLQKEVWWWRPGAKNHPESFNSENSLAFNYELVRRFYRKERFPPFPVVAGLCRFAVSQLDEDPIKEQICRFGSKEEKGWTVLPPLQWNLTASDYDLTIEFLRFIQPARAIQNVSVRTKRGRRPRSWTWLELMDIDDLQVRTNLDSNERSKLSVARRTAAKKAAIFDAAIAEFREWQLTEARSNVFPEGFSPQPVKTPLKTWRDVWPTERKNR